MHAKISRNKIPNQIYFCADGKSDDKGRGYSDNRAENRQSQNTADTGEKNGNSHMRRKYAVHSKTNQQATQNNGNTNHAGNLDRLTCCEADVEENGYKMDHQPAKPQG